MKLQMKIEFVVKQSIDVNINRHTNMNIRKVSLCTDIYTNQNISMNMTLIISMSIHVSMKVYDSMD